MLVQGLSRCVAYSHINVVASPALFEDRRDGIIIDLLQEERVSIDLQLFDGGDSREGLGQDAHARRFHRHEHEDGWTGKLDGAVGRPPG